MSKVPPKKSGKGKPGAPANATTGVIDQAVTDNRVRLGMPYLDLRKLPREPVLIGAVAPRKSGKSTMIMNMIHAQKPDYVFAFCGSEGAVKDCVDAGIPPMYIYREPTNDDLQKIFDGQVKRVRMYGKENAPLIFIVVDDFSSNRSVMRFPALKILACNGRHYNITVLISTQNVMDLPSDQRQQYTMVFTRKIPGEDERKKVHRMFFTDSIPAYKAFDAMMAALKKMPYTWLVANNDAEGDNSLQLFQTKPLPATPPLIGNAEYRLAAQISDFNVNPLTGHILPVEKRREIQQKRAREQVEREEREQALMDEDSDAEQVLVNSEGVSYVPLEKTAELLASAPRNKRIRLDIIPAHP